jgi:hypothetical protein
MVAMVDIEEGAKYNLNETPNLRTGVYRYNACD